jgi:hypothetical protein
VQKQQNLKRAPKGGGEPLRLVFYNWASDFESDANYFRGFLTRFLTDFFHIRHADFNGEHLSYLNNYLADSAGDCEGAGLDGYRGGARRYHHRLLNAIDLGLHL